MLKKNTGTKWSDWRNGTQIWTTTTTKIWTSFATIIIQVNRLYNLKHIHTHCKTKIMNRQQTYEIQISNKWLCVHLKFECKEKSMFFLSLSMEINFKDLIVFTLFEFHSCGYSSFSLHFRILVWKHVLKIVDYFMCLFHFISKFFQFCGNFFLMTIF